MRIFTLIAIIGLLLGCAMFIHEKYYTEYTGEPNLFSIDCNNLQSTEDYIILREAVLCNLPFKANIKSQDTGYKAYTDEEYLKIMKGDIKQ